MPTLETADGKPIEGVVVDAEKVNREFDAAMNADGPADDQAPPRRQPRAAAGDGAAKPRRTRQPKAEKSRTSTAPVPEATPEVTARRAKNASETIEIAGGVLGMLGSSLKSPAFKADGYVFGHIAPKFGEAVAEVARYDPTVARWLDKPGGGKVAAYMGLFGVAATLGAQLAVNHGVLKPGVMGSVPPEEIIKAFEPEKPAETTESAAETTESAAEPAAA